MYDAGGFFLPFAVTGSAILASGLTVLLVTEVRLRLLYYELTVYFITLRCQSSVLNL